MSTPELVGIHLNDSIQKLIPLASAISDAMAEMHLSLPEAAILLRMIRAHLVQKQGLRPQDAATIDAGVDELLLGIEARLPTVSRIILPTPGGRS